MSKSSYELVNYQIRPLKQIERKLVLEGLLSLKLHSIDISSYQYVGFGSIYFHDFTLFHKYLNINEMICIEKDEIEKRMEFNKPYDFIKLWMGDFTLKVPELIKLKKPQLLWLDFDGLLDKNTLDGISNYVSVCLPGTILILTINCHPGSYKKNNESKLDKHIQIINDLTDEFGNLVNDIEKKDVTPSKMGITLSKIIKRKIKSALLPTNMDFFQLFNYTHKDNSPMLTYGGIIGDYDNNDFKEDIFVTEQKKQKVIKAPPLTNKEKKYFDANLNVVKSELEKLGYITKFEIKPDLVRGYIEYYRHYPEFHEVLV